MRTRLLRPLDRYVLNEFLKILSATAIGFPVLVIIIDITENLNKYLQRHLPPMDIAKAYVFGVPWTMFQVLPAAVLFATVFSIGGFTRHSEISAAKASGISFYRFIAPIAWGAAIATVLGLMLGAVMPGANSRRDTLLKENHSGDAVTRANFTFATAPTTPTAEDAYIRSPWRTPMRERSSTSRSTARGIGRSIRRI